MNQTYKKQLRCKLCGIVSVYNELLGIRTNKLTFKAHLLCTYQKKTYCYSINKPEVLVDGRK